MEHAALLRHKLPAADDGQGDEKLELMISHMSKIIQEVSYIV